MHFARFVLKGFIISAALCFPSIALADKTDHTPPLHGAKDFSIHEKTIRNHPEVQNHLKESVHVSHSTRNHTLKPLDVTAEQAVNINKKPHVVNTLHMLQKKNVVKLQKENSKVIKSPSASQKQQPRTYSAPKAVAKENNLPRPTATQKQEVTNINRTKPTVIKNVAIQVAKSKKSLVKKSSEADFTKKRMTPLSNAKEPLDYQLFTAQGEYSLASNTSKERFNLGTNLIHSVLWYEWDKYRLPCLDYTFRSNSHKMSNQWTNAPPSQPPKSFLL